MKKVKQRLKEPSTWAGLAGILEGVKLLAPQYAGVITGVQAIAGGVAVLASEKGAGRGEQ